MMELKPFTPADAEKAKKHHMHPIMIDAVNELLGENYNKAGRVKIYQEDVIQRALQLFKERIGGSAITEQNIYDYGWLDFEDIFRNAGWNVQYDRPAYYETYKAYYMFTKKS